MPLFRVLSERCGGNTMITTSVTFAKTNSVCTGGQGLRHSCLHLVLDTVLISALTRQRCITVAVATAAIANTATDGATSPTPHFRGKLPAFPGVMPHHLLFSHTVRARCHGTRYKPYVAAYVLTFLPDMPGYCWFASAELLYLPDLLPATALTGLAIPTSPPKTSLPISALRRITTLPWLLHAFSRRAHQ